MERQLLPTCPKLAALSPSHGTGISWDRVFATPDETIMQYQRELLVLLIEVGAASMNLPSLPLKDE